MKLTLFLIIGALATFTVGEDIPISSPVYGYLEKVGVPTGERIRRVEEEYLRNPARIVGGSPSGLGEYPYQAGLLSEIHGISGNGVCGATLIGATRVLTAAHCWFDGRHQAWKFTVVLGSNLLYSGGTRIGSSAVSMHPNWRPLMGRNDIAVIYLPSAVTTSAYITPIALPSDSEANDTFIGARAVVSGFGLTSDDDSISIGQSLSHVRVHVISNNVCSVAFPLIIQPSHLCTSGVGGKGPCRGDSGGPLAVSRNNRPLLIGISSFMSALGCESGLPAVFARITNFLSFINQHL